MVASAIEARLALVLESAGFEASSLIEHISGLNHHRVLIFGGQLRVSSLFMPSEFRANSFSRFRDPFRGSRHFHAPSAHGAA